jgi:vacuolar-type H+-ATPase subunit F/Vma7
VSYRLRVLCRPAVAGGFRLAGLEPIEADGPDEAARWLAAMLDEPDLGLVLMEDDLHAALPDAIRRRLVGRALPMIVPFPGPAWGAPPPAEAFIAELLRQAIGYRVRLA